jgi:hypothetical protein
LARKRMIDPNFWIDEKLGRSSREARLMFMGCISQSDDDGRLQGHTALLKSLIFPYDMDITIQDVEGWLIELEDEKLLVKYEVENQSYIAIPNFSKHQTINKRTPSKLPSPPVMKDYGTPTVEGEELDSITPSQEKRREEKGKEDKEKGSEDTPSSDTEKLKDDLHNLMNKCNIQKMNLHSLDLILSYLGMVEPEIIEAAIKKGEGKHINYVLSTLEGMYKEGITKKEQLYQKPTPGKPIKQDKLPEWIETKHEPIKPKDTTDAEKRKIMEERLKKLGEWEEPNEPNQT